jgi:hypothetical membrane protein
MHYYQASSPVNTNQLVINRGVRMSIKAFVVCGILAPILYVAAVIGGGLMWPGYSHVTNYISDLIGSGAPHKWLLDPAFGIYNIFCFAFGLGAFLVARAALENKRRMVGLLGATFLVLTGVLGFTLLFFPEDPVGAHLTSRGITHIVLAGISSLTTMVSMLLLAFWFRGEPSTRGMGIYSFISVGFVFVTGGFTGAMGVSHNPLVGLMERLTIGGFMQWLLVVSVSMLAAPRAEARA